MQDQIIPVKINYSLIETSEKLTALIKILEKHANSSLELNKDINELLKSNHNTLKIEFNEN